MGSANGANRHDPLNIEKWARIIDSNQLKL